MNENAQTNKMIAFVACNGSCNKSESSFNYHGSDSCREALSLYGGAKTCANGCLGLGSCVKVCKYNAISIVDGVAVVDRSKCTGCGFCAKECPKSLISLIPYENIHTVACSSNLSGRDVKRICDAGCIGCAKCQNNCPVDAIIVTNNLAKINYDKCVICNACYELCPTKCIK